MGTVQLNCWFVTFTVPLSTGADGTDSSTVIVSLVDDEPNQATPNCSIRHWNV